MYKLIFSLFPFLLVPPNPLRIEAREVKERTVTIRWSPVFDGGRPITAYRIDIKNKQSKHKKTDPVTMTHFERFQK